MTKLSDATNEEAIEILAEILEPCSAIFTDTELKKAFENGESQLVIVKKALQNHKSEIIQIMATLDGVPVEDYKCNIFTLPLKIIEILNDKELAPFFQ